MRVLDFAASAMSARAESPLLKFSSAACFSMIVPVIRKLLNYIHQLDFDCFSLEFFNKYQPYARRIVLVLDYARVKRRPLPGLQTAIKIAIVNGYARIEPQNFPISSASPS